jgi:transcriptional regulator
VYVPPHFRQDDIGEIHALIRSSRLATLITVAQGAPSVSHVPMLLDDTTKPYGTLLCHLSRANDQWRAIGGETEALVIFMGPDAYVTPSWYESKREHGKVVPTWNYVAVHAYGPIRVVEDPRELRGFVERLTHKHEANRAEPWDVTDAPEAFIEAQLGGIVGLEIAVRRFDAKWKLSQNRSRGDVAGVIAGLEASENGADRATAAAMRAALPKAE